MIYYNGLTLWANAEKNSVGNSIKYVHTEQHLTKTAHNWRSEFLNRESYGMKVLENPIMEPFCFHRLTGHCFKANEFILCFSLLKFKHFSLVCLSKPLPAALLFSLRKYVSLPIEEWKNPLISIVRNGPTTCNGNKMVPIFQLSQLSLSRDSAGDEGEPRGT